MSYGVHLAMSVILIPNFSDDYIDKEERWKLNEAPQFEEGQYDDQDRKRD
jgi:hypothetical protein